MPARNPLFQHSYTNALPFQTFSFPSYQSISTDEVSFLKFDNGCDIMPQCTICQNCGTVLYEGTDLKPPDEIIQQYDGKCPKCGKKLSSVPKDVEVKPVK